MESLKDPFIHVTNPILQKKNSSFIIGKNYDAQYDNDWTLKALENYFKEHNLNYGIIWERIKDILNNQLLIKNLF